jgi:DNA-binding response OmpR family regulator
MIVSSDLPEVSVFECILNSLHIGVDVETEANRAWNRLIRSKVDALILDCDLGGTNGFLKRLEASDYGPPPLLIFSGTSARRAAQTAGSKFVVDKPVSVDQAVHTLSAARNIILKGRLNYHRQTLDMPVTLTDKSGKPLKADLLNLSLGGIRVRLRKTAALRSPLQLKFVLPETKLPIETKGKLAWSDEEGNAGISFAGMREAVKRDLQLWLERQYFGA